MNESSRARDTKNRWLTALRAIPRTAPGQTELALFGISVSSYLMLAAALITATVKIRAVLRLDVPFAIPIGIWATLADLGVYFALAAALALLESWRPALRYLSWTIAGLVFALACANAGFLVIAGEQGNLDALVDLWERRRETWLILGESLQNGGTVARLAVTVLALVAPPLLLRQLLKRRALLGVAASGSHGRTRTGLWIAVPAAVLALGLPHPSRVDAYTLGENAMLNLASGPEPLSRGTFQGYPRPTAVTGAHTSALSKRKAPDVLIVIIESLRFDHTSLAGKRAKAKTPNLLALAERGFRSETTRAVLPHTTKSVFSVLCGRLPTMQRELLELDAGIELQCLPHVLADAGYRTAFFQSAAGTFEQRPRLAHRLGFAEFRAAEDLRGKRLGYVGSEDASLVEPVLEYFARDDAERSFVTVLTSATHHPYRLAPSVLARAKKQHRPFSEPADAYARMVEEADRMLGALVQGLTERGRLDDTIIVVLGDHGEGFGHHGISQHDNDYFEEGLRVPLVLAGPGIPKGGRFDGNASLLDVTPSVLGALDVEFDRSALDGFDLLHQPPKRDEPRPFGCFRPARCRGFVSGRTKVVAEPRAGRRFAFDLERDPDEIAPLVLSRKLAAALDTQSARVDAHRNTGYKVDLPAVTDYAPWTCPEARPLCQHPKASSRRYRPD
jgi:arylsulfatase A-like enzyme